jgi:LysR family transcriptional regulator, low CO2-responsive transcriptional regulator
MREKGSGTRELIESALDKSGAKPIIAMEIGSNETIKRAVEGNIGLAFLRRPWSMPKSSKAK